MKRLLATIAPLSAALLIAHASPARAQHSYSTGGSYDPRVPPPSAVLGYEIGERFTPHHMLVRYLEALAASSDRVRLDTVAHSFEGREVMLAIVTSEANQARINEIRDNAALVADPRSFSASGRSAAADRLPVIVWLGFTVHGPEASGVEAALAMLYQLAAGQDADTRTILDSAVVLIDPVQNPDGHERHVQDVMRRRSALGVPVHPDAMIHGGTWPGPRTSHYYFDLNRDWFTQSHPETRGRVQTMLTWWPHVAVDLHEMGSNATYFFPPPMAPVNRLIGENTFEWWDIFATAIIDAFDAHGWSFFRREGYDEFYPGYGSSWPIYSGAAGMTYEQASSRGGAIRREDGTILTLREAAHHHYEAAWATALAAARRASERVSDYAAFRASAGEAPGRGAPRSVIIARDGQGRADSLASLLIENGIEVKPLAPGARLRDVIVYGETERGDVSLAGGGWLVGLVQPQGELARALLEPDAPLDSAFVREELARRRAGMSERFYDLTAWSLPYLFRVRAWWTADEVGGVGDPLTFADSTWHGRLGEGSPVVAAPVRARYGYAFAPGSEAALRTLARLLQDSVRVWYAPRSFRSGADSFPNGAFVVRVAANDSTLHERVRQLAAESGLRVASLGSAGVDAGTDLGSNSVFPVRAPRIALLGGEPVSGSSFGYAWYAFDQRLSYPVTAIDAGAVRGGTLSDFDVLVVPSVSASALSRVLGDGGKENITAWVRGGGTLITLDAATSWLASEELDLSRLRVRGAPEPSDSAPGAPLPAAVPGAIVRVVADTLSPLLAGVNSAGFPALVFSGRIYDAPNDVRPGEVVVRYAPEEARLRLAGYLWPEVPGRLAGTTYLWSEEVGNGRVIGFAADPNFRDMWRGLLPLFANSVFLGGSY